MNRSYEASYGIPHPKHLVEHAERIMRASIPTIPLDEIGIDPALRDVLEEGGLSTVGQLSSRTDTELYTLEAPVDHDDLVHMQRCLGRVGLSIEEVNSFHFDHPEI